MKSGIRRQDIGREKFLEEMWKWMKEYQSNISNQIRKMGASVSWQNERFTLDAGCNKIVEGIFVDLYNK